MAKKKNQKRRAQRPTLKKCYFHESKKEPSVSEISDLNKFLTERGKIVARMRSGLCAKHQRAVTREIKHARHLGLLSYVARG